MNHYQIYGLRLESSTPIDELVQDETPSFGSAVQYQQLPPMDTQGPIPGARLLRRMALSIGGWISHLKTDDGYVLRFEDRADFHVAEDGSFISCRPVSGVAGDWITATLCGLVMSYVLLLRGTGNIHASAIALPDGVVGFIGVPGTGKSTFATSMVLAGFPLLTDDVLALRQRKSDFEAMPGFPVVGMSATTMAYSGHPVNDPVVAALLAAEDKVRMPVGLVGGEFEALPKPLLALYILSRQSRKAELAITTLAPQQAMQWLFEHTPSFELLKSTSLAFHWKFIGQVVSKVPVRVLSYPTGFENLPRAIDAVVRQESTAGIGVAAAR